MAHNVILSPHFDDAVLDCWHLLIQPETIVMNVFAGAPPEGTHAFWDRVCGETDSPKMVQKRKAENETAVALSGNQNQQIYLDFLDGQYRSDKPDITELADAIEAASPADIYYTSLATSKLFRHADHVLLRKVGLELLKRDQKVGFYPDSPYMNPPRQLRQSSLDRLRKRAEKFLGIELSVQVTELDASQLQAKDQAMRAYKTQYTMTNAESFGGLRRIAKRGYEVVLWPKD